MILSICIPTYNRLSELKVNLRFLLNEVERNNSDGKIEVVVSDNKSDDGTFEYLNKIKVEYSFLNIYSNPENIGMVPNWKRVISLAKGKYVWLLGSDDIVIPGRFSILIDSINRYPDINLFLLTSKKWKPSEADFLNFDESEFTNITPYETIGTDQYVSKTTYLLGKSPDQFTPIYLSIMKRDDWGNAVELYDSSKPFFSNLNNSVPQAVYIAENLFKKDAYYIGTPLVLTSVNIGWKKYLSLYWCYYLPCLHDVWLKCGADRYVVKKSLKELIADGFYRQNLKDLLLVNRGNFIYIDFLNYIKILWKYKIFHKNLIYICYYNSLFIIKKLGFYSKK